MPLPDTLKGAHVGGANTGNVGVCYVGGVDKAGKPKDTRTPAQSAALRKLVETYRAHPRPDRARPSRLAGRGQACPSFDVAAWLDGQGWGRTHHARNDPPAALALEMGSGAGGLLGFAGWARRPSTIAGPCTSRPIAPPTAPAMSPPRPRPRACRPKRSTIRKRSIR
jgi:hypothetical protein